MSRARPDRGRTRKKAEARGRRGERIAALWLTLKGWRIIERRARTGAGEIDLVAARGRVLAFIEVKTYASAEAALAAVTVRQQTRLARASALWRARRTRFSRHLPRFDVVAVAPGRLPRHLKGAFQAEGEEALRLL